jgi:5'-3' exonuclease
MQVHLVDGTYELFRNWFGAPPRRAPDGREVGATIGLMRTLGALLREPGVTHVAVAFDHVIESFRNELFAGYKTSEGVPEELLAQFEPAERAARSLGLVVWPMIEFEADDALATAAARFEADSRVERVVICTPDKDLAQCVRGTRVVCLDRRRQTILDEAGVVAKFGVPPASIPDWLALVGDDADGIPGLPGFGARTAAALLARYRTIDEIADDPTDWPRYVRGATNLAAILRGQRESAQLYRTLATLRTDAPLAESLADLEWKGIHDAEYETMMRELGGVRGE